METKTLDREFAEKEVVKLKKAFPNYPEAFFDMLIERILANDIVEIQLEMTIDYVIDTVKSNQLSIADVIEASGRFYWDGRESRKELNDCEPGGRCSD
ncbi:MAG: hypothetical protein LBK58_04075 [Prevotellaceae bacterium]|nr:hypothetical protein [Prevotellaceae bacterium]